MVAQQTRLSDAHSTAVNEVPARAALPHLETFARVRLATPADVEALEGLERNIGSAAGGNDWERFIASAESRVVLALECERLVGAAVMTRAGPLVSRLRSAQREAVRRTSG